MIESLTDDDVNDVFKEVKDSNAEPYKVSFLKALCYIGLLCKKDRKMKLEERAAARFEENLDIRSFISVYTNMTLALNLLFSKEQLVLFKHHYARSIPYSESNQESSDSEASKTEKDTRINLQ